ncbi:MAG: RluA family pseudouridine synthase [Tissierellia bacterium]|nr:RluA family pseudouridine synthase [Bacillota bacterium]NLL23097.1 RluA family pseudouridine synthase [Tissierellia bacterium]
MILQSVVVKAVTLRQFLRNRWNFSSRLMKELAAEKKVFVDGRSRRMDYLLKENSLVTVDLGWEKNTYEAFSREIDVLYEDEGLMILNKDPLFSVHPVGGHRKDTVLNAIVYYQQRHRQNYKIRFAHRLDRDTSGALIVAKNKWMHEEISRQFRQDGVLKEYLALCHNSFSGSFVVEGKIGLSEDGIHREFRDDGKESCTQVFTLASTDERTLFKAVPQTGRTHQIRVHLASKGYPIVGDALYGVKDRAPRQMLHCHRLQFRHPLTGEIQSVQAPLKQDFLDEMEVCRLL